jgi:electron transfer flavoprotein alpha subunit
MERSEWRDIWVYLEQIKGAVEPVSWEILGKARELADKTGEDLVAVLLGRGIDDVADEAIKRGADRVLVADAPTLEKYTWEAYTKVITDIVEERKPSILLIGATHNGRELAGRLAVRLNTGLTADVVRLEIDEEGVLLSAVPGFGGSMLAIITCEHRRPQMSTVRPGIFTALEPDASRRGEIMRINVDVDPKDIMTRHLESVHIEGEDISKAERLVAAGRGAGGDIKTIRQLADLMNAAVGVTRPLADVGVMSRDSQIGSTGVTVRPKLALVAGVSGAIHFVSGIQDSDTIISINIDPDALMFEHSDYCVVGDVNEILPALVEELKTRKPEEVG